MFWGHHEGRTLGERIASVLLAVRDEDGALAGFLRGARVDVVVGPPATAAALDHLDVAVVELAALMAGAGWLGEARRRHPELEVVVVALPGELPAAVRALRQGASDLLTVPLDPASLLGAVAGAADRSRARAAMRDASELVRWAELGRLCGGLTHEFANPVTVMLSATSAIEEALERLDRGGGAPDGTHRGGEPSPLGQVRDAAREATAGAERLKVLARDLRSVVRADPAALGPVEVAQAVKVALRLGRAEIGAHLDVRVEVPPRLGALASAGALAEALLHLLVGAARAVAASGQRRAAVEVRAVQRGDAVVIEVEDAVPAQPPVPALRYLALQLPPGLAPGPGARALVAARELVEKQGGACAGRVAPGGGTVVEITLPAPVLPHDVP